MSERSVAPSAEARVGERLWWPHAGRPVAGSTDSARALAAEVIERNGPLLPSQIVERFGFRLRLKELRASQGGLQAVLVPSDTYKFTIVVDSWTDGDELAVEFRIGHELGHTFFYNWKPGSSGQPERTNQSYRLLGMMTDIEELFCDAFAARLIEPFSTAMIESR